MKGLKDILKNKKEELEILKQQEEEARNDIKELADEYSLQLPDIMDVCDRLNKLPFESLKELYDFQAGETKSYKGMLDLKSKLQEKKEKRLGKLDTISSNIVLSKIDILLSEIDCINSKLN